MVLLAGVRAACGGGVVIWMRLVGWWRFHSPRQLRAMLDTLATQSRRDWAERQQLLSRLDAVRAVLDHARKISPSASMHVYVADLERALGLDVARPHKTGSAG